MSRRTWTPLRRRDWKVQAEAWENEADKQKAIAAAALAERDEIRVTLTTRLDDLETTLEGCTSTSREWASQLEIAKTERDRALAECTRYKQRADAAARSAIVVSTIESHRDRALWALEHLLGCSREVVADWMRKKRPAAIVTAFDNACDVAEVLIDPPEPRSSICGPGPIPVDWEPVGGCVVEADDGSWGAVLMEGGWVIDPTTDHELQTGMVISAIRGWDTDTGDDLPDYENSPRPRLISDPRWWS